MVTKGVEVKNLLFKNDWSSICKKKSRTMNLYSLRADGFQLQFSSFAAQATMNLDQNDLPIFTNKIHVGSNHKLL